MTTEPWRHALINYIRQQALPIDKYGHQPRLYALTQSVGEGSTYDDDVVFAAAWMHDLGVFIGHRPEDPVGLASWDNVAYAIAHTPGLLLGFGFPEAKIPAVLEAMRTHQPHHQPTTLEAEILRDADILEQLGAMGILRAVLEGRTRHPVRNLFSNHPDAPAGLGEVATAAATTRSRETRRIPCEGTPRISSRRRSRSWRRVELSRYCESSA